MLPLPPPRKPKPELMPDYKPETPPKPRGSIFDAVYSPIGSETRKGWSRLDRRKP